MVLFRHTLEVVVNRVQVRRPGDLGLAVAEARRALGLTQAELADRSGVTRSYLAKVEAGLSTLLVERLLALLRRLDARLIVEIPSPPDGLPDEPLTGTLDRAG